MSTPRDLMRDTWTRWKQLALLKGQLEDYILYTLAKLSAFACGVAAGVYLATHYGVSLL